MPIFFFCCNYLKIDIIEKIIILHKYIQEGILTSRKIELTIECKKYNCSEIFLKYFSKPKIEILKTFEESCSSVYLFGE